ncbi:MAG: response regulator [bacterium]
MAGQAKDFKIGIVDDHVQTAISISQILEFDGFKTYQAYNAEDAIAKTKEQKPDLLLLNIRLGKNVSGYDIVQELPQQKILFLIGGGADPNKIKKFKNVIGAITKPVDKSKLLKIIRKEFKLPEPKEI